MRTKYGRAYSLTTKAYSLLQHGVRGVLGLCTLACEARGKGSNPFGHPFEEGFRL